LRKVVEIIVALCIVVISAVGYGYACNLVTGVYEPGWAYKGIEMSNKNVMLVFLFAVSGGGVIWMIRRKIQGDTRQIVLSAIGVVLIAMLMALSMLLRALIPLMVILYIVGILFDERKKRRREEKLLSREM